MTFLQQHPTVSRLIATTRFLVASFSCVSFRFLSSTANGNREKPKGSAELRQWSGKTSDKAFVMGEKAMVTQVSAIVPPVPFSNSMILKAPKPKGVWIQHRFWGPSADFVLTNSSDYAYTSPGFQLPLLSRGSSNKAQPVDLGIGICLADEPSCSAGNELNWGLKFTKLCRFPLRSSLPHKGTFANPPEKSHRTAIPTL
jgi:hypothetical protein